ncbi:MAG TPA: hypothetical protein VGS79_10350 [Puia sp.]|nr:hypothetical protein [Puia sp.]
MNSNQNHITVFEHQILKVNQETDGGKLTEGTFNALQAFFGEKGVPYFTLIRHGVRFNEYVGVIQVGNTVIEVLPKTDQAFSGPNEKKQWRDILINMLISVGIFDIHAPSSSSLNLKSNSILDLYIGLFVSHVESLIHNGLIKQYRKKEGNVTALKGCLQFGKQIQKNLTHQERFYVRHSTYDLEHKLHFILYKTICLIHRINTNAELHGRIGALILLFPEMPEFRITQATFSNLVYNRKNHAYKVSIAIAELLLLNFHPDVSKGRKNVLALMFDMNKLWEQFVYISLKKYKEIGITISSQTPKYFWKPLSGSRSKVIPDLVINKGNPNCVVLDTKWKNLNGYNPSPEDLRQMYVYHEYYSASKVALVYPGFSFGQNSGVYLDPETSKETNKECSIIFLSVEPIIKKWQQEIYKLFKNWLESQPICKG